MILSKLHTDCQIELYKRLNLNEHFNLRATCRTLNASFITNSAARNSLFLNLSPAQSDTDGYGFQLTWNQAGCNGLSCPSLTEETCAFLLDTFPNITTLQIRLFDPTNYNYSTHYSPIFTQIATLLDGWSTSLKSLTIAINISKNYEGNDSSPWSILPASINGLSSLKALHLYLIPFPPTSWCNLPILGQLEEFTFQSCRVMTKLYDSLVNFALPNTNLRSIALKRTFSQSDHFVNHQFLNQNASFTRKFTSLGDLELTGPQLVNFAPKFTSLIGLSLSLTDINANNYYLPLNHVTSLIATHLPQVAYLTLRLDFNDFPPDDDLQFYTPLPAVKMLHLEATITDHSNISKYLKPHLLFPNLQDVLTGITGWRCPNCGIDGYYLGTAETRQGCRELLERPFEECPKLSEEVIQLDMWFWNRLNTPPA